ncbi:MAG: glycosyltransferase [Melioribacteraceae bacterium]|nr:glycosyltransferase [Melioribacteraceae bacterium]
MIDLSIIIVNYNVKEFVLNLLQSIQEASKNIKSEIIIVDNASDDDSVELIQDKYPAVKLISNKENVGFGRANNQGMKVAEGKYILLLNPDTIVREDTFEKMILLFQSRDDIGIAGCKVLNPDGTLQLACRRGFPGPWTSFTKIVGLSALFPNSKTFARYNLTYLDENKSYEVDAVSGSFMMMKREIYELMGGFDSQFFMYGEDLDLCFRTQKAGYKIYYFHETEIIHYKGESTKRSSIDETKVFYDAMHLFVQKHFSASFIVESILQFAIFIRKFIAFTNIYKNIILAVIADLIIFTASVYFAEKIYSNEHWIGFPEFATPWVYFLPAIIQVIISSLGGAYKKRSFSVLRSTVTLFFGMLVLTSLTYFFKQFAFSRAVVLITYLISFFSFTFWRIIAKAVFKFGLETDTRNARTLIVGNINNFNELASRINSNFIKLHQIIGFIGSSRKNIGESFGSLKVLGSTENLKKIILEENIQKVIISSDGISYTQMFGLVSECNGLNVEFLLAGKEMDYMVGKSSITMLDDIPLLKLQYNISSFSHRISKRMMDLLLGFLLLLIYPFVYLLQLISGKGGKFTEFIMSVPEVLSGKKSLVGPKEIEFIDGLYVGKAGLTGFWFIENISITDNVEMKKLDLFYAKNQSLWLDLEILGKSFSKVFISGE